MAVTIEKSAVVSGNFYLSSEQQQINAIYIYDYLKTNYGWTDASISAILGNMETESTINPGIYENLEEGNTEGGFGLVQWTPATKLIEWASGEGLDYTDIDTQLKRIKYEVDNGLQWITTEAYPMTFDEFVTSEELPETLAQAFLYNYERPAELEQPDRSTQARAWYDYITGSDFPLAPPEIIEPIIKRKGLTLWKKFFITRRVKR